MADLAGVTKMSQINYEKAERSPDAAYLAAIAEAGADVQYILTGQRSANAPLPADESLLLDGYRASSPETRKAALRVLLGGDAPMNIKQKVSAPAGQVAAGNVVTQTQGAVNVGDQARGKRKR